MPTWYGNVCRTGRRRDERGREPMAADASALPHLSTSLSRGRRL